MPQRFEYHRPSTNVYGAVGGSDCLAQTFTVGELPHTITSVKIDIYRWGLPGTLIIEVRSTDTDGLPTAEILTSGSIDANEIRQGGIPHIFYEIPVTEVTLEANTKYAIVARAPAGGGGNGNLVYWWGERPGSYANGECLVSTDGGETWRRPYGDVDRTFEVWGNPIGVQHTLAIDSSPASGVSVSVDGTTIGNTPVSTTVTEGTHTISVPEEV